MNIKDFDRVQDLIRTRSSVMSMQQQVGRRVAEGRYSEGGGDSLCVSLFSDGSGSPMDFSGCFIGTEVLNAIWDTLRLKLVSVEKELIDLGVDIGIQ